MSPVKGPHFGRTMTSDTGSDKRRPPKVKRPSSCFFGGEKCCVSQIVPVHTKKKKMKGWVRLLRATNKMLKLF